MTIYVSVNVGGTWTRISVAEDATLIACVKQKTKLEGKNNAIALDIIDSYQSLLAQHKIMCTEKPHLGISFAGMVKKVNGHTQGIAPNMCGGLKGNATLPNNWQFVDFSALDHAFARLVIRNDVVAETLIEHRHGALRGYDYCALIGWGTGVGSGIIVGGALLTGYRGIAGHIGHQFVSDQSRMTCGCGNVGDLESNVGSRFIESRFGMNGKQLFQKAKDADQLAQQQVDSLIQNMARCVFNLVAVLDLEAICFGGSVFSNNEAVISAGLQRHLAGFSSSFMLGVQLLNAQFSDFMPFVSGFSEIVSQDRLATWIANPIAITQKT